MKILGIYIIYILSLSFISINATKSGSFSMIKLTNKLSNMSSSNISMENKRKKIKLLPGNLYFQGSE